jgi:hypothetical protein
MLRQLLHTCRALLFVRLNVLLSCSILVVALLATVVALHNLARSGNGCFNPALLALPASYSALKETLLFDQSIETAQLA